MHHRAKLLRALDFLAVDACFFSCISNRSPNVLGLRRGLAPNAGHGFFRSRYRPGLPTAVLILVRHVPAAAAVFNDSSSAL